ncbi:MAG: hypothetical protein HY721_05245 [Planctomycetes bacterium]|nr:hypothetical protein [Planctomycetota bacterium]
MTRSPVRRLADALEDFRQTPEHPVSHMPPPSVLPSKDLILERRAEPAVARLFRLAFERRPAEELYDLARDPGCLENIAASAEGAAAKERLRSRLERWMRETGDPGAAEGPEAAGGEGEPGALAPWDSYPYFGSGL